CVLGHLTSRVIDFRNRLLVDLMRKAPVPCSPAARTKVCGTAGVESDAVVSPGASDEGESGNADTYPVWLVRQQPARLAAATESSAAARVQLGPLGRQRGPGHDPAGGDDHPRRDRRSRFGEPHLDDRGAA